MNRLDFLSNVLQDYCNLHDLPFISADDLLYESNNNSEMDCYTKLTIACGCIPAERRAVTEC